MATRSPSGVKKIPEGRNHRKRASPADDSEAGKIQQEPALDDREHRTGYEEKEKTGQEKRTEPAQIRKTGREG